MPYTLMRIFVSQLVRLTASKFKINCIENKGKEPGETTIKEKKIKIVNL